MIAAYVILGLTLTGLLAWWVWKYYYYIPQTEIKFAKSFFIKNTKDYKPEDFVIVKKIHLGYTNLSFYIQMSDGKEYQLRFAKNNAIVNRENERKVINLINKQADYLYYDQYGNYIKKWVKGRSPKINEINNEFLLKLKTKINDFHNIKVPENEILKHNYENVLESKHLNKKYLDLYSDCLKKLNLKKLVLSHNDLNVDNIVIDENNSLLFLDFEWTRMNTPLWDIVNFCRESSYSYEQLANVAKLYEIEVNDFINLYYISLCFALDWTYDNSFSFKIFKYRLKVRKQIASTFRYLKKVST